MKYLLSLLAILAIGTLVWAQQVTPVGPNGIACAYNSSPPTITSGSPGWAQCDSTGHLLTSSTSGGPITAPLGPATSAANAVAVTAYQNGIWQVTPTLTAASVLTRPANATAYTAGQLIASNGTAGSIVNPSFAMPSLGGAIPRLRLISNDTTSTAWASASVQIDLWSAAPTWTNGDHAAWLPATGSASHIASYTCTFPSAVWGDGLATECTINQGNYLSTVATTVYWSAQALGGSGVLSASAATLTLRAELN